MTSKLHQIATNVVLYWHQGNGNVEQRIHSINEAVKTARLKATFVQSSEGAGWTGRDAAIAKEFRHKIDQACIQGWIEREIAAVESVIQSYRNIPLRKRLLRWIPTRFSKGLSKD